MNPFDWANCDPNDPDVLRDRQKESNARVHVQGAFVGIKLCAVRNFYICTRSTGHDGPHMALTLSGRCLETWELSRLEAVCSQIASAQYLHMAFGQLFTQGART